jgi:hypothetical protein
MPPQFGFGLYVGGLITGGLSTTVLITGTFIGVGV